MSDYLYEIALMGGPSDDVVVEIKSLLQESLKPFELTIGVEVRLTVGESDFNPSQERGAAVAFFGAVGVSDVGIPPLLRRGIPVIPVVYTFDQVPYEIPEQLRHLNCLSYMEDGALRITMAILECIGLLQRQRRVFLSYRRDESRIAALQLFDELSARNFNVFLDTHGIGAAVDFQAALWHRLCECDVLVMLDTPNYFDSRWASAEFGRALSKGIPVLRVGWPGVKASERTAIANHLELSVEDVDVQSKQLSSRSIKEICLRVERLRSQSHAVRGFILFSKVRDALSLIGGNIIGKGVHNFILVQIPSKGEVIICPCVGIPTSLILNEADDLRSGTYAAVVYDALGVHPKWVNHLLWMNDRIRMPRYIKADEAAWDLADLEE